MDFDAVLRELRAEVDRLDRAIECLRVMEHQKARMGRGRKSMGAEERKVVSERKRKYWACRRAALL
jgi:hypothetical protein